ncbi:MAG TPA: hypothetical protein VJ722_02540 [Rhodanobacteraceae bacterium]|nr:hypothetical protein [Rhodanobacteraceae bacterium]
MSTNPQPSSQGVYSRFFMHENRRHHGVLLYDWLCTKRRSSVSRAARRSGPSPDSAGTA